MDLARRARRRAPGHQRPQAGLRDGANALLLLTVSDVTDARLSEKLKDDLVREKTILLQEVQHRVANSLQIIARSSCRTPAGCSRRRPAAISTTLTSA